jgi:hypothetical protein
MAIQLNSKPQQQFLANLSESFAYFYLGKLLYTEVMVCQNFKL